MNPFRILRLISVKPQSRKESKFGTDQDLCFFLMWDNVRLFFLSHIPVWAGGKDNDEGHSGPESLTFTICDSVVQWKLMI